MATYNRGRHILPSVRSVLGQTFKDFELLVVGDHCTDNTEAALELFLSDRVRWTNLDERGGSQSFPNNRGIALARGRYIAYLGHDDIWAPDHLEAISARIAETDADYVVSGLLTHSPPGVDRPRITGLFDESSAALTYFFPPSSIAHKRDVTARVGPWRAPLTSRAPVDIDLQLRAARARMSFVSTGRVTVHKFTAVQRYLSYLKVESTEQAALLKGLTTGRAIPLIEASIQKARASSQVKGQKMGDYDALEPGEAYRASAARKGSIVTAPRPLGKIALLPQIAGNYAKDWAPTPRDGFLWNGESLQPKLRIPFSSTSRAMVTFTLAHPDRDALRDIELTGPISRLAISEPVAVGERWEAAVSFRVRLNAEYGAVVGFMLRTGQRGIGIGTITVRREPSGDRQREALKQLEQRLHDIEASSSWRLTAPLRRLVDRVRKVLRKR